MKLTDEREPVVKADDLRRLKSYEKDILSEMTEYGPEDGYKYQLKNKLMEIREEILKQNKGVPFSV